jgi:spore coat protein H
MILENKTAKVLKLCAFSVLIFALSFMFIGCIGSDDNSAASSNVNTDTADKVRSKEITVKDNKKVYMHDEEGSVVTMYLTVRRGNNTENTNHSWNEVNSLSIFDYELLGVERFGVEGILKIGDENGPVVGEFGYGVNVPNAIVSIRGNTTSRAPQKSFKIEIKKDRGTWRSQRTIALNKHPYDHTRLLNKLCYDLEKDLPDMISARTQFVHLYVKDETGDNAASSKYEDYGLFTQVEQINKTYLANHGLDENGHLYKANQFEFHRSEDVIKLASDPDYDLKKFEEILEVKGNEDHTKLIKMLEDVNNYATDIKTVFEKHFDENNYFTWMAFNILTGNIDTMNRNFYLYSPLNSDKWYFIPWDNDGAFSRTVELYLGNEPNYGHEMGISNYWGFILHNRVLSDPGYRQKLDNKIEELRQYLTKERINGLLETYKPIVKTYLYSMPDIAYAEVTEDKYDGLLNALLDEIDINYKLYKESLEKPMPFFIDSPVLENEKIKYTWGASYDFKGEDIKYQVQIARDLEFKDIIATFENVDIPIVYTDKQATGQYFIRVKAVNASGKEQYAQDYYRTENTKHFGILVFYVQPDGTIEID